MTFVSYYLLSFLRATGWPRKVGILFFRKEVVDAFLLKMVIKQMAEYAIILGALRPKLAISLIADMAIGMDPDRSSAEELWAFLNPTKSVTSHPELEPAEAITNSYCESFGDELSQNFFPWKFLMSETIVFCSHMPFLNGLVWGFDHPEEALAAFELNRTRIEKELPDAVSHGLKLDAPYDHRTPTADEICNEMRGHLDSFQKEVRPLFPIPHDLLSLPQVIQRIQK